MVLGQVKEVIEMTCAQQRRAAYQKLVAKRHRAIPQADIDAFVAEKAARAADPERWRWMPPARRQRIAA